MTTKNAIEAAKITKELKNFTLDVENFAIPQGFATALIGENAPGVPRFCGVVRVYRVHAAGRSAQRRCVPVPPGHPSG